MSGAVVQTVTGPVDASDLGFTLPHEHVYLSLGHIAERFDYPLLTDDAGILADEFAQFRQAGGVTIVDATPPDIGRRPNALVAMSGRTGVRIVAGAGWYRAPYYRPQDLVERRTVRELAAGLVRELRDGIDATGIRPGLIGELGVEKSWVSPIEERTHRAAGRAQAETGAAILTHSVYGDVGLAQLDVLEEAGADPTKVAIGHADTNLELGYLQRIVDRGALVMFDSFMDMRGHQEERSVDLVCELVRRGHAGQILLSLDICRTHHLTFGGGGGFAYLGNVYLPKLRAAGLPEADVARLTIGNPARWLGVAG
jgi:phosphotriesterase-related protein